MRRLSRQNFPIAIRPLSGIIVTFVVAAHVLGAAQKPTFEQVLDRLGAYTGSYSDKFSTVIADENSYQWVERTDIDRARRLAGRSLKSDYAVTRIDDTWVAYRDPYEVDGIPVRGRDNRLMRLMADGQSDALQRIAATRRVG